MNIKENNFIEYDNEKKCMPGGRALIIVIKKFNIPN